MLKSLDLKQIILSLIQRNQQRLAILLEIKGSMLNLQVIILPTLRRTRHVSSVARMVISRKSAGSIRD